MRLILFSFLILSACATKVLPPEAKKVKHSFKDEFSPRYDNYFWMQKVDSPEVLAHLKKERKYADSILNQSKNLRDRLFTQAKAKIYNDKTTLPYQVGSYLYYNKNFPGKNYQTKYRKKINSNKEEVVLDVNEIAKGTKYFRIREYTPTRNGRYISYALDLKGSGNYQIFIKDLSKDKIIDTGIKNARHEFVWSGDENYIFYIGKEKGTQRQAYLYRYNIKNKSKTLIHYEKRKEYSLRLKTSDSGKIIFLDVWSRSTEEKHYIDAYQPLSKFKLFKKAKENVKYTLHDGGDRFYIITNENSPFKEIQYVLKSNPTEVKKLIPPKKNIYIATMRTFKNYLAIIGRVAGKDFIHIYNRKTKKTKSIKFTDGSYDASITWKQDYQSDTLRIAYESMRRPETIYDINMASLKKKIVKEDKVLGGFSSDDYVVKQIKVKSHDGVLVPVTILHKKNIALDGSAPLILYGYGAYGYTIFPRFRLSHFTVVDRGFIFAIVHVRGGNLLGDKWYTDGKLLKKKNTFYDFIAAGDYFVNNKYTSKDKMIAYGESAGGLLTAAAMNMRPDLFKAVIGQVPFTDVLTAMLDESLPLTVEEYSEWGNPKKKKFYHYMRSYSPNDNITKKKYPHVLAMSGYHDNSVQYWHPAKWVAKLRDNNLADTQIVLDLNMDGGHKPGSKRHQRLKDRMTIYAYILNLLKLN